MGSQVCPKTGPTNQKTLVKFWNPDFLSLEALQVPLESRLEPLMLVLRAPKTRKVWFSVGKITFFAIAAFRAFEALEILFGSILAHHGLFSSKMAPKMIPKQTPKIRKTCPKIGSLVSFILNILLPNFGVHFVVQNPTDEISCWQKSMGY